MDIFSAISDPTRRQIIESLAAKEASFGELAAQFEMSRPAVSQHLKVLRDSGVVKVRADAQRRLYSLNNGGLDDLNNWLETLRSFWNPRLDRLEVLLNEEDNHDNE
ncbi:MAG: metalloregulator ArsR/SmtB family transcription factor [Pseudomonadota bacterium]